MSPRSMACRLPVISMHTRCRSPETKCGAKPSATRAAVTCRASRPSVSFVWACGKYITANVGSMVALLGLVVVMIASVPGAGRLPLL